MSAQDYKVVVETAWRAFCRGDLSTAFAHMTDDVRLTINANIPGVPAVHAGKEALRKLSATAPLMFPSGLRQDVTSLTAQGDTVVMEYRMSGPTAKGRNYENAYCIVCRIESGKLAEIREYTDTYHIAKLVLE